MILFNLRQWLDKNLQSINRTKVLIDINFSLIVFLLSLLIIIFPHFSPSSQNHETNMSKLKKMIYIKHVLPYTYLPI